MVQLRIKTKNVHIQDVVIGGWTAGQGRRAGSIGALLFGIPDPPGTPDLHDGGGLRYIGRVGTGFTAATLADLARRLAPLESRPRRLVPRGDLVAAELLFDRILKPGESHTFDFEIEERNLTQPVRDCRRWAGPPALERLAMTVQFDAPPRQVLSCQWRTRADQPHAARPVLVIDGVARLRLSHPVPGMYGLSWRW